MSKQDNPFTRSPFEEENKQRYREDNRSSLESHVATQNKNAERPNKLHFGQKALIIFRHELAILLDERLANRVIQAVDLTHADPEQRLFSFNTHSQDSDFIIAQIQKRLASTDRLYMSSDEIKAYLEHVRQVFYTKLALGDNISAMRFIKRHKKKASIPRSSESKKGKQGKKCPIIRDGQVYPSIAAAAQADPPIKYDTLQKQLWRQNKQDTNLSQV